MLAALITIETTKDGQIRAHVATYPPYGVLDRDSMNEKVATAIMEILHHLSIQNFTVTPKRRSHHGVQALEAPPGHKQRKTE